MDNDQALPGEQFNDFVDHPLSAEEDRPFLHLKWAQAGIWLEWPISGEQSIQDKGVVIHRESSLAAVSALLSDHADRVMAAAAPDQPQQTVVELLFRAAFLAPVEVEPQQPL